MPARPARRAAEDYRVAVPSYQRVDMLADRTLPALAAGGVELDRVTVFVHSHDPMLDGYRDLVRSAGMRLQVTDVRGINAQRAAILQHFPAGTPLVQVDDDLQRVVEAVNQKTVRPVDDLGRLFRGMFRETAARDLWVWGLSPTTNPFYMSPGRHTEGLRFLMFALWGCYTRPGHPVHTCTVPTKDDYELSLRAWWYDGATLRADGIAPVADIYKAPGGCQLTRRVEHAEQGAVQLMADWPGLVRRNTRRRSKFTEITLSVRGRTHGNPPDVPPPGAAAAAD
jgi:hypothetical protein